jgi:hypothetical protein
MKITISCIALLVVAACLAIQSADAACGCSTLGKRSAESSRPEFVGDMKFKEKDWNKFQGKKNRKSHMNVIPKPNFRSGTTIVDGEDGDWERWPNKVVTWKFESAGSNMTAAYIKSALDAFEKKIGPDCIKFVNKQDVTKNEDHIKIINGGAGSCWSYIGRIGYEQQMSLGDQCNDPVVVQHEFMHALGFYHEHNRPDRDTAVNVLNANVDSGTCPSFNLCKNCRVFTKYNTKSIMQYPSYAFSCNGQNTVTNKGDNSAIAYNFHIQDSDVRAIKCLYKCGVSAADCTP